MILESKKGRYIKEHPPISLSTDNIGVAITDMRLSTCYSFLGLIPACNLALDKDNEWKRLPKDLYLGRKWFKRVYLDYKTKSRMKIDEYGASSINEVRIMSDLQASKSPNKVLEDNNWSNLGYGLWVRRGMFDTEESITGVDFLYGKTPIDPRPGWSVIGQPLLTDSLPHARSDDKNADIDQHIYDNDCHLSVESGLVTDDLPSTKQYQSILRFRENGKFKILQVADAHLVAGYGECRDPWPAVKDVKKCLADPITIEFINTVLDIEDPDLVVMTGDQVYGSGSKDVETALFKAAEPFIKRRIPFAMLMGNHDSEGDITREQIYEILKTLPYSVSEAGPKGLTGSGNFYLTIGNEGIDDAILYLVDSHSYSRSKIPGYDYIREDQREFIDQCYQKEQSKMSGKKADKPLGMAFFHIPLPEYREFKDNVGEPRPMIGSYKEGCTAPMHNSHFYQTLKDIGVSVVSVGHDHCNDYCLDYDGMWLCYGGAVGEGGYGGYGGTTRRMRVFELDKKKRTIKTWKRLQTKPDDTFDEQVLYSESK